jgi:hypothetical protein
MRRDAAEQAIKERFREDRENPEKIAPLNV